MAGSQTARSTMRRAVETGNQVNVPAAPRRMGLGEFIRRTAKSTSKDHVSSYAGDLAFRGFLAVFPALLACVWLLSLTSTDRGGDTLVRILSLMLPEDATNAIRDQVADGGARISATNGVIILLLALWSLTMAFRSAMKAQNVIYNVEERRPKWQQYVTALLLSLAVYGLMTAGVILIVFGSAIAEIIAERVGFGVGFQIAWSILTWPLTALGVGLAFGLTYYFGPNIEQRCRWVSWGTAAAVVLWLIFTVGFSLWVRYWSFDRTYGTLAGIAVLLVYFYGASFSMLLGAEMNRVLATPGDDAGDHDDQVDRAPAHGTRARQHPA